MRSLCLQYLRKFYDSENNPVHKFPYLVGDEVSILMDYRSSMRNVIVEILSQALSIDYRILVEKENNNGSLQKFEYSANSAA